MKRKFIVITEKETDNQKQIKSPIKNEMINE
jgi:hypothetical protein